MPRNTTTGKDYENIVQSALEYSSIRNGFTIEAQQKVGQKPGGGKHIIDLELVDKKNNNIRGLVSCKFQGTGGTAEEKLAYEVIKLLYTMDTDMRYKHSWIFMGGDGWGNGTELFVKNHLPIWMPMMRDRVTILYKDDLANLDIRLV